MFQQGLCVFAAGVEQVAHLSQGDLSVLGEHRLNARGHQIIFGFAQDDLWRDQHQFIQLDQGVQEFFSDIRSTFLDARRCERLRREPAPQGLDIGLLLSIELDRMPRPRYQG